MTPKFVLASASPRRKELLAQLIPDFIIDPADLDEDSLTTSDPRQTAEALAEAKAKEIHQRHPHALVLGADTVVSCEGRQLAKPATEQEAEAMLQFLSGKTHQVYTGIALVGQTTSDVASDVTHVTFKPLSERQIKQYVATKEPMDKAGGYGIQGGAKEFVERIEGSLSNVVGLPLETLERLLKQRT
jgi:septum formation protein